MQLSQCAWAVHIELALLRLGIKYSQRLRTTNMCFYHNGTFIVPHAHVTDRLDIIALALAVLCLLIPVFLTVGRHVFFIPSSLLLPEAHAAISLVSLEYAPLHYLNVYSELRLRAVLNWYRRKPSTFYRRQYV